MHKIKQTDRPYIIAFEAVFAEDMVKVAVGAFVVGMMFGMVIMLGIVLVVS